MAVDSRKTREKHNMRIQLFSVPLLSPRFLSGALLSLVLSFWLTPNLDAQVATADVLGTVTDTSSAVVPGAALKLENAGTHETRNTVSGVDGSFTFSSVQPGTYQLTVTANGFKMFAAKNIVVVGGDRVRVDVPLQIGVATEQVEVTAQVSALQTDSTNVGTTITGRAVQDIPINGRNYMALVQVAAGVNAGSPQALSGGGRLDDRRPTSAISANGQQESANNQLVDGMDNSSRWNAFVELRPSVEAIEQVRTDVNTYSAEVGHTAGASINLVTKSGTNQLHGSVFEFFRNDATDARNFFATTNTLSRKPELRQNQFGGSLGGPIVKDKTFFFADFETFRRTDGNNSVYLTSVPTAFEQQNPGNLTDIGGLVIPMSSINPTSLGYFETYPLPNTAGTKTATGIPQNNFLYNPPLRQTIYLGDIRVDQHFNANNLMFARFSDNLSNTLVPAELPPASTGAVSAGVNSAPAPSNTEQITHNAQVSYTHIFSPNLVSETKASYTFFSLFAVPLNYGKNWNDAAPYLIPNANECLECSGLASIALTGSYANLGDQTQAPADRRENNYEIASSLTWIRGNHTVKFGGTLMRRNVDAVQQFYKAAFTFNKGSSPVINLEQFLTGSPYQFQRTITLTVPHYRSWEPAGFIQDDWHAARNLTLNVGLRYEVFTPFSEKDGKAGRFDLPTLQLVTGHTAGVETDYSNINPRFGFAFTPRSSLVIRGGFGISHFPSDYAQASVLANPPNGYQTGTITQTTPISAGVPAASPQPTATASLFGAVAAKPASFIHAYVEQFNLLVQKEAAGTVFTVGYVGELGRHLLQQIPNIDIPIPAGPSPAGTPPPPAPYAAALPKVNTIAYWGDSGVSNYNSLQLTAERRLYKGLSANLNYTFAHALDDAQNANDNETGYGLVPTAIGTYDYGNSYTDVKHRIAGTFTYLLPFGNTGSTGYKILTSGWQVNGLGFWQTGTPITIDSSYTQNGRAQINISNAVTTDRPNRGPGSIYGHGETINFLNPAAFVKQPLGTAGNIGRNQFYGPHLRRGDLSLFKTVPVHDSLSAQFRVECFNITNTPNFAQPNSAIASYNATPDANGNFEGTNATNFGTITSTAFGYSGRQFQFALRLVF
jgi:hypothetical protein